MWDIGNQIKLTANELGINVTEIQTNQSIEIKESVINKFIDKRNNNFLWEGIANSVSIKNKDAWKWVSKFIRNTEAIMFFNDSDEKKMFSFENGDNLVNILSETDGFEFYITNKEIEYIICFNHHDVLIASGSAKDWLITNHIIY